MGKNPTDTRLKENQISLVHWDSTLHQKGKAFWTESLIPLSLDKYHHAALAKNCFHKSPKSRPTMAEVLGSLELAIVSQHRGNNHQGVSNYDGSVVEGEVGHEFPKWTNTAYDG